MIRVRTLVLAVVPSLVAGGLVFSSALGQAEAGREDALGFWPAASDTAIGARNPVVVAQADPRPRVRPHPAIPPAPPAPPVEPGPPAPPLPPPPPRGYGRGHNRGMSISIHDGKVEIDGVADLVQDQLDRVAELLDHLPTVPPEARERVKTRIKAVRDKLHARLSRLRTLDLDKIGPEMERMGDEIEREMEGIDKDLAQFGDKFGARFSQDFAKFGREFAKSFAAPPHRIAARSDNSDDADDGDDADDDDKALPGAELDAADASDMRSAVAALKGIALDQSQKDSFARMRADSDRQVAAARRELEAMSNRLHDALGNPAASEGDIARQIDQISAKEATIRKARLLTWIRVRSLLREDQRRMVEAAVKRTR
jgi:hypothetical protein